MKMQFRQWEKHIPPMRRADSADKKSRIRRFVMTGLDLAMRWPLSRRWMWRRRYWRRRRRRKRRVIWGIGGGGCDDSGGCSIVEIYLLLYWYSPRNSVFFIGIYRYFRKNLDLVKFLRPWLQPCFWTYCHGKAPHFTNVIFCCSLRFSTTLRRMLVLTNSNEVCVENDFPETQCMENKYYWRSNWWGQGFQNKTRRWRLRSISMRRSKFQQILSGSSLRSSCKLTGGQPLQVSYNKAGVGEGRFEEGVVKEYTQGQAFTWISFWNGKSYLGRTESRTSSLLHEY